MKYEQAYKDHCYLWGIGPAADMTGGYVDSEDLHKLLSSPTKSTAANILCAQIEYWFQVGPDMGDSHGSDAQEQINNDPLVKDIAERHGCI